MSCFYSSGSFKYFTGRDLFFFFPCFRDFTVRVVDVETSSEQVLRGHEAPVLSVAIHPQGGYVVRFTMFVLDTMPPLLMHVQV